MFENTPIFLEMMRVVALAVSVVVPTNAHRVHVDTSIETEIFDTCNDLQNSFHTRVQNIQALQEAHPDSSSMSATTQARFTMRAFGIVRLLRRAKDCPWVVDGNLDGVDEVRSVAHSALAGNPCGDAAMEALSAPPLSENVLQPLQQAVQILLSDNCEASGEIVQNEDIDLDDETMVQRLIDREAQAQDQIDEFMDAAVSDGEHSPAGAFVQTEGRARSVARMLGVVFLTILYMFSCAGVVGMIVTLILFIVASLPCLYFTTGSAQLGCFVWSAFPGLAAAGAGFVSCGIDAAYARGNFSQLGRGN